MVYFSYGDKYYRLGMCLLILLKDSDLNRKQVMNVVLHSTNLSWICDTFSLCQDKTVHV